MISRWRIEATADDKETVNQDIEDGTVLILSALREQLPDVEWELLNDPPLKVIQKNGRQMLYRKRVFVVSDK